MRARIRLAQEKDIGELLELMRQLAQFEDYLTEFRVTDIALRELITAATPTCFFWVAEQKDRLLGYAVSYIIPFTFDVCPSMVLKELFVLPAFRDAGIGAQLFRAVQQFALIRGASRLKWEVLRGNSSAERFYQRLGAQRDEKWLPYQLRLAANAEGEGK